MPAPYRDEHLAALRAMSRNANPTPLWRMVDRAQRFAASVDWTDRDRVMAQRAGTNALVTPEAAADNVDLRDAS